jgi:hypothetical protein
MLIRRLGYRAQELEAQGRLFLLSDSIPVALKQDGEYFRTDRFFSKATTGHINKWLKEKDAQARKVAHETIAEAFAVIDSADRRTDGRRDSDATDTLVIRRLWKLEQELEGIRNR